MPGIAFGSIASAQPTRFGAPGGQVPKDPFSAPQTLALTNSFDAFAAHATPAVPEPVGQKVHEPALALRTEERRAIPESVVARPPAQERPLESSIGRPLMGTSLPTEMRPRIPPFNFQPKGWIYRDPSGSIQGILFLNQFIRQVPLARSKCKNGTLKAFSCPNFP